MRGIEFGTCDICGKETDLERTYFYYPIHCDRCGSIFMNGKSGSPIAFEDEEWLRAYCSEQDWQEIDGKLYCPGCVEYDEETDVYKPKKKD